MENIIIINNGNKIPAAMFNIEGEMMNVLVKQPDMFKTGESVICLIEKESMKATVIKKSQYNLYLFIPLIGKDTLSNRRKSVRCPLNLDGELSNASSLNNKINVSLVDISLHGLALKSLQALDITTLYRVEFMLETNMVECKLKIKNEVQLEKGFRYGCIIDSIEEDKLFYIRKFILQTQLRQI
ncbi:PilZ domain-containing protein [Bacillus sp. 31A1R]|uniref:PilZ domain-containing protein n=1 Tax=Robertmurraya mangrovi TaxID=3098077 RepID=A0ABU5ITS1_9BACI|nr:PilZ domain-containing protein [Bacillus sp. 31A1R]MDZ5470541.1 PilZ domain-containing protein [Bacillus sp. 31A1R]